MDQLPYSITIVIALLTLFLILSAGVRYSSMSNFARTRLVMTAFFFFIVCTLTVSFSNYTTATLPYTVPAFFAGILLGYYFGVQAAEQKLKAQGLEHYLEHFAHVHFKDIATLNWWSVVNFYTVMGGLVLINLVGASTVLFHSAEYTVVRTSAVGAFLLGTIVPYLLHLWSINVRVRVKTKRRE